LSALIAYCGTSDLAKAEGLHPPVVPDRQLGAVDLHATLDVLHAAVETDKAAPEGRLSAARLAGESHDLAVADREGDAVERLHVATEAPVVDLEAVDGDAHLRAPAAAG
jgi:hypothetical protein